MVDHEVPQSSSQCQEGTTLRPPCRRPSPQYSTMKVTRHSPTRTMIDHKTHSLSNTERILPRTMPEWNMTTLLQNHCRRPRGWTRTTILSPFLQQQWHHHHTHRHKHNTRRPLPNRPLTGINDPCTNGSSKNGTDRPSLVHPHQTTKHPQSQREHVHPMTME